MTRIALEAGCVSQLVLTLENGDFSVPNGT